MSKDKVLDEMLDEMLERRIVAKFLI